MKKLLVLLCGVCLWLVQTSCEDTLNVETLPVNKEQVKPSPKVEKLIQQVRMGEVEAYKELAFCYRDGDGVEPNALNMMFLYGMYSKKKGGHFEDFIEKLDVNDPFRLLADILAASSVEKVSLEKVEKLRSISPADACIYDAFYGMVCRNDTLELLQTLQKAEKMGSDMACLLQVIVYEKWKTKEEYEQCLHRYADRFPVFYVELGDLCIRNEREGRWEQAAKYYQLADKAGMLTPRGARCLSAAYRQMEKEGKMTCDAQEMERLKVLGE